VQYNGGILGEAVPPLHTRRCLRYEVFIELSFFAFENLPIMKVLDKFFWWFLQKRLCSRISHGRSVGCCILPRPWDFRKKDFKRSSVWKNGAELKDVCSIAPGRQLLLKLMSEGCFFAGSL
jgi:hypothetical protein